MVQNNNQNLVSEIYPNPDGSSASPLKNGNSVSNSSYESSKSHTSKVYLIVTIILTFISLLWAFYAAGLLKQSTCDSGACILMWPIIYFPNLILAIISIILIRLHFKHSEKIYTFKYLYYLILILLPFIFFVLSSIFIGKTDNFYMNYINRLDKKLISVNELNPSQDIVLPKDSIILGLQGTYYAFDKKSRTVNNLSFTNSNIYFSDDKSKYAILKNYSSSGNEYNIDQEIKIVNLQNTSNSWLIKKNHGDSRSIESIYFTTDGSKLIVYLRDWKRNGRFSQYGVFDLQSSEIRFYDKSTLDKKYSYTEESIYPKCKSTLDSKGLIETPQNGKYYSTGQFNKNCDSTDSSEPEYIVLDKCAELFDYNNPVHRENFEDYNPCKAGQEPDNIIIKYLPKDPNNSKIVFDLKKEGLGQAKINDINISKDFGLFFRVKTKSNEFIYNLDNDLSPKNLIEIKNNNDQDYLKHLFIVAEY